MGYEEPSSKRPVVGLTPDIIEPQKRGWVRRVALLAVTLGAIALLVANYDFSDPGAALSQIGSDVGAFASRLGGGAPQTGRGRGNLQAPPVRVAAATVGDVPVIVRTIGTVLANSVVVVKSQVDGPLLSANFKEGQMVKRGDLLFRIDPAPFQAALRQSEAAAQRDRAQQVSAQADADRAVMLAERGIVSAQQRDQLVAQAKALAASVAADEAAIDRAKLNLGYTDIRSPIDGKTGPLIVHPGNQVRASDPAGLVTITQIQPVKIAFNLPQGNLPQLQDRMREGNLIAGVMIRNELATAVATVTDSVDKEIPVKVDFIGNVVDDRTGTIELRATFDNPDLRLVPGELVDISVRLMMLDQVVTVPRDAVNVGQDGNYVFVVDGDSKAQMRPTQVLYQDQNIAALASGVEPGERVVTDGQLRVNPGIQVLIVGGDGTTGDGATQTAARLGGLPDVDGR